MFKEKVENLLNQALDKRIDLFLIECIVGADNNVTVVLDGDHGITLNDCIEVSRAIEHNLDREEADFSLQVTSAGATAPLELPRQYKKNIGRSIEVTAGNGHFEGKLTHVKQETITLQWKAREPKPIGKGKHTVEKKEEIAFSEIEKAQVKLKF